MSINRENQMTLAWSATRFYTTLLIPILSVLLQQSNLQVLLTYYIFTYQNWQSQQCIAITTIITTMFGSPTSNLIKSNLHNFKLLKFQVYSSLLQPLYDQTIPSFLVLYWLIYPYQVCTNPVRINWSPSVDYGPYRLISSILIDSRSPHPTLVSTSWSSSTLTSFVYCQ